MRIDRGVFVSFLVIVGAAGVAPPARCQAGAPSRDSLLVGAPIDGELSGGQSHSYRLALARRQFVRLVVEQHGVDVVVVLLGPQGDSLAAVDSPNGTDGPEPMAFISTVAGTYQVVVSALEASAPRGRYRAIVTESRAATATDQDRLRAEQATAAGLATVVLAGRSSLEEALRHYRDALAAWDIVGDSAGITTTIVRIADALDRLGQGREGLVLLDRGIAIAAARSDTTVLIDLLNEAGQAHDHLNEPARAVESYARMRTVAVASGNRAMEGTALSNASSSWDQLGRRDSAITSLERALTIARDLRDSTREAAALNNVARLYQASGETERALAAYHRALDLTRAIPDLIGEMSVSSNLGGLYSYVGANDQAITYRQRALTLARQIGSRQAEATSLNNLAISYEDLGDTIRAIDFLHQALTLAAQATEREVAARANENLGRLLVHPSQRDTALRHLERALALWRDMGIRPGEATTLGELAFLHAAMGHRALAWSTYEQALTLMRQTGQRTFEARTLRHMAQLAEEEGDLARARALATENLALVERIRGDVGDRRLRTSFLTIAQSAYTTLVDILMRQHLQQPAAGHDRAALEIAERARARGLLDALADAHLDPSRGLDTALVTRERRLAIRVDSLAHAIRGRIVPGDKPPADLQHELDQVTSEHQAVRATIRTRNPDYVSLTAEPLDAAGMQATLDSQTTLLVYFGTDAAMYRWVITRDAVQGSALLESGSIAPAVRRYLELVAAKNHRVPGESPYQWRTRLGRAARELPSVAMRLSRSLLGSVGGMLRERILIVGSGALQYLPFAALPVPAGAPGAGQPLVLGHEVIGLPSMSTVAALRLLRAARPEPAGIVAVIADPVFAADDRRVDRRSVAPLAATAVVPPAWQAATRDMEGDGPLPRLAHARAEALAISALVAPDHQLLALDFDADVPLVTGERLRGFRILHFATHGFVNSAYPELSGVALSMVGRDGAVRDGYLRLQQIYGLRLPVDLVVLSACQTALGQDIRGEGLVGLTRGFMYAGASRVVASLWKVDDEATAELMRRFYLRLLGRGHPSPAAALRAAQTEMSRHPRWHDPYYWAGFTIQGDWT